MSERLYVTDAWLEDFAKSDLSHMRDLARELIERRAADQANADQARRWQREAERVKQELANAPAQEAYDAVASSLAAAQSREVELRHALANSEQANELSDEDREALTWFVAEIRDHLAGEDERVDGRTHKALAVVNRLLARGDAP